MGEGSQSAEEAQKGIDAEMSAFANKQMHRFNKLGLSGLTKGTEIGIGDIHKNIYKARACLG